MDYYNHLSHLQDAVGVRLGILLCRILSLFIRSNCNEQSEIHSDGAAYGCSSAVPVSMVSDVIKSRSYNCAAQWTCRSKPSRLKATIMRKALANWNIILEQVKVIEKHLRMRKNAMKLVQRRGGCPLQRLPATFVNTCCKRIKSYANPRTCSAQ